MNHFMNYDKKASLNEAMQPDRPELDQMLNNSLRVLRDMKMQWSQAFLKGATAFAGGSRAALDSEKNLLNKINELMSLIDAELRVSKWDSNKI